MAVIGLSGGDKLQGILKKMSKKVSNPGVLRVGFLENASYPNGTPVAMVAAIQEFGAPKKSIPPRPFFRTMIAENSPEWGDQLGGLLKDHNYDAEWALGHMGQGIKGQLQKSIIDLDEPALSPITLMLRKMRSQGETITGASVGEAARRVAAGESTSGVSIKPLVDTKVMLQSVDYEVEKS